MEKQRLPLVEAEALAAELVALLGPACERLVVAGSIRRRKPDVGDIELVAITKMVTERLDLELFRSIEQTHDLLHDACTVLLALRADDRPLWTKRLSSAGVPAWGPLHKRATWRGFGVDLFCATPANWGWILVLRTGGWEFNKRLVTERRKGGAMPEWIKSRDGSLWAHGEKIYTADEESVFEALGLQFVKPEARTADWRPVRLEVPA